MKKILLPLTIICLLTVCNSSEHFKYVEDEFCNINYNNNSSTGGTVPIDEKKYEPGEEASVLGNTGGLVKNDLSFLGWNTVSDGSGTTYLEGQSFIIEKDTTLYAMWMENSPFTVKYHSNGAAGGDAPVDTRTYKTGQAVKVQLNTGGLYKDNYEFVGWNTSPDGTGTAMVQGQNFVMSNVDIHLYAQYARWIRQSGLKYSSIEPIGIDSDSAGNIITSGRVKGYSEGGSSAEFNKVIVQKYNNYGVRQYVKFIDYNSVLASYNAMSVDSSGNIYFVGSVMEAEYGNNKMFATKYNPSMEPLWSIQYRCDADSNTMGTAISTDKTGSVFYCSGMNMATGSYSIYYRLPVQAVRRIR